MKLGNSVGDVRGGGSGVFSLPTSATSTLPFGQTIVLCPQQLAVLSSRLGGEEHGQVVRVYVVHMGSTLAARLHLSTRRGTMLALRVYWRCILFCGEICLSYGLNYRGANRGLGAKI